MCFNLKKRDHRLTLKLVVMALILGFLTAGSVQAEPAGRVMTKGQIVVYRDGALSQVLREDAPLPTGVVLKPQGDCGIRLTDTLLVAKDGSEFGVYSTGTPVELALKHGTIYFAVNHRTGQMVFETPAGSVTTRQFIIQAATEGTLRGFVEVNEGATTLGVLEGGAMVVSTPKGEETIEAGQQIILAQSGAATQGAEGQGSPAAEPAQTKSKISKKTIVNAGIITAFAGAGAWWALETLDDDDNDPAPASPSAP